MATLKSKNQQIMILRSPSLRRDSFFRVLLLASILCLSGVSLRAQGIIGTVVEDFSRQPITNAHVVISFADSVAYQGLTDSLGRYAYQTSKAGRILIEIKANGYIDLLLPDLILDGYSTQRLDNSIEKNPFDLPGVTVRASPINTALFVSKITPDDMVLVAGNFEDPVRIAHSQPGIVMLNDQANQLSARGQSPVFNNWYLEGLEIVNPNHTSNAGTFSDLPTQYGGGINMFSAQTLGSTDLYLGVNPLSIGSTNGAAIDMHLHESATPEWRAKAGLIGFELGGGAAFGPQSILDFNLRYSFTGLLTNLGADFGGEKIGFYDGVLSFRQHGKKHKLKLFAWAGHSENEFDKVENPDEIERYKDFFDIDYGNEIIGAGSTFEYVLTPNLNLRTGAGYSSNQTSYSRIGQFESQNIFIDLEDRISIFSSFLEFSIKSSNRIISTGGIHYRSRRFAKNIFNPFLPFPEESLLRPYINTTINITSGLKLEAGGEVSHSFTHQTWDPGYRAALKWNYTDESALFAGVRHGIGEALFESSSNQISNHLQNHHYEFGWNVSKIKNAFSLNLYYHRMSRMTTIELNEGYLHLADYPYNTPASGLFGVYHQGQARYYGIEGQWEFNNTRGWRCFVNQSVYKSERGLEGENFGPGRYDGQYATHLSVAREIIKEKEGKARIWNFSLRGLLHGGLWEESINEEASDLANLTLFSNSGTFDQQLPAYKRIDFSIVRTIGYEKVRWRWSLDIQNLLGLSNLSYHYYDPFLDQVIAQEQLGIIPVLSVQASW